MSFRTTTAIGMCVAMASVPLGCGGDDDGGGGGQAPSCGTAANPEAVVLTDVQPAAGSTVDNVAILHAFTVVDSPGMFETFTFELNILHTAGSPVPGSFSFTITPEGANHRYEAHPIVWASPPGNVSMIVNDVYQTPDGCAYRLPAPLFAYSVTAGGGGSGGTGGTGGTGGSGGGASGGGGAGGGTAGGGGGA